MAIVAQATRQRALGFSCANLSFQEIADHVEAKKVIEECEE